MNGAAPQPAEAAPAVPESRTRRFVKEWVRPLLVIGLVLGAFRSAVADWNDVPTGSMKPTILEGDRIVVDRRAFALRVPFTTVELARWQKPKRGEIVVLQSPEDGKRLVKRVVGIPGDRIQLVGDRLVVNGEPLVYRPAPAALGEQLAEKDRIGAIVAEEKLDGAWHPVMIRPDRPAVRNFGPVVVPEGRYFLMGDNRDESYDSRFFGTVAEDRILGRARAIAGSLDIKGSWAPRWKRFFSPLG